MPDADALELPTTDDTITKREAPIISSKDFAYLSVRKTITITA
jgi:hypothetical protein